MNDVISVIVPVYNVEKYLERCLDSIINQTYKNLEIILIDDGSTDSSGLICDEFAKKDERIKVIHKVNEGSSSARNFGLDIARGLYIGFVDSDDYIESVMYEKLLNGIKENNADISICSRFIENESGEKRSYVSKNTHRGVLSKEKTFEKAFAYSDFDMAMWDKLYKIDLFNGVRFPIGHTQEDYYVTLEIIEKSKSIFYIPEPYYHYIQREGSVTKSKKISMDGILASKYTLNFFANKHPQLIYIGETALAFSCIGIINKHFLNGIKVESKLRKYCKTTVRESLWSIMKNKSIGFKKKLQAVCFSLNLSLYKVMVCEI